ncbi:MAG: hypothetical protein KC733_07290 [Candidatus Omnitrophica bacterium]|nr:hypothetical protein [Candidatus Omnitrophota bacterium]
MRKNLFIILSLFIFLFLGISPAQSRDEISGEIINVNHHYKIAFTDLSSSSLSSGDLVKIIRDGKFITYLEVSEASSAITKLIPVEGRGSFNTNVDFSLITVGSSVVKMQDPGNAQPQPQAQEISQNSGFGPKPSKGAVVSRDSRLKEDFGLRRPQPEAVERVYEDSLPVTEPVRTYEIAAVNPDHYTELSDNYAKLSKSFGSLLEEKKSIELKCQSVSSEVESLRMEVQQLTEINIALKDEIRNLELKQSRLRNDDSKQQLNEMRETINQLKRKLERMTNLLKGSQKPYED